MLNVQKASSLNIATSEKQNERDAASWPGILHGSGWPGLRSPPTQRCFYGDLSGEAEDTGLSVTLLKPVTGPQGCETRTMKQKC